MLLQERDLQYLANEREPSSIAYYYSAKHWNWYERHKDDIVIKRQVLRFFSIVIRVKDLTPLFYLLWGEPPAREETVELSH